MRLNIVSELFKLLESFHKIRSLGLSITITDQKLYESLNLNDKVQVSNTLMSKMI